MTFNLSKRKDGVMPSWSGHLHLNYSYKKIVEVFVTLLIFRKKCHKRIYTSSITLQRDFEK